MTRSPLQPGPAQDHYHETIGVDEQTPPAINADLQLTIGGASYFDDQATGTDGRIVVAGAEGYPQIGLVGAAGSNGSLSYRTGRGTLEAPEESQDGDFIGIVEFYGMGTTGESAYGASLEVAVDGSPSSATRVPASVSLYVSNGTAPTLRLQITANGNIIMPTLPTADPHVAGALWNSSTTLKVSAG